MIDTESHGYSVSLLENFTKAVALHYVSPIQWHLFYFFVAAHFGMALPSLGEYGITYFNDVIDLF